MKESPEEQNEALIANIFQNFATVVSIRILRKLSSDIGLFLATLS
jgi:hypothetical protein